MIRFEVTETSTHFSTNMPADWVNKFMYINPETLRSSDQ